MDVASFVERCSDWESDEEKNETLSPWPVFIHEEILTERARLRIVMKDDIERYKSFLATHMKGFMAWWQQLDAGGKTRVFQVPDDDLLDYFHTHVKVKGSYEIVLCAVLEQLRHFKETGYKDGRVNAECYFERFLQNRASCFTMDPSYINSTEANANFFEMLRLLGGPRLLPIRQTQSAEDNNQAEQEVIKSVSNVQSFRSDRRLVRLAIVRKFADIAIRRYMREVGASESGKTMSSGLLTGDNNQETDD
ncbi:hypothetical protein PINS_up000515 [Pythium insidiosum]|nr:hypothetical protein PINS_up000515 [Pythium insidiosum]